MAWDLGKPRFHAGPLPALTTRLRIRFRFGSERATTSAGVRCELNLE